MFSSAKSVEKYIDNILAPDTETSEAREFINQIRTQYGERYAFQFAFMYLMSTHLVFMALPVTFLTVVGRYWWFSPELYLRILGLGGLLIPSLWGSMVLGYWDRETDSMTREWGLLGVKEVPMKYPGWKMGGSNTWKNGAVILFSTVVVSAAVFGMLVANFVLMEIELMLQIAPLCDSFFHKEVWADNIAWSGANSSWHHFFIWPDCYPGPTTDPFTISTAHGHVWRGLMMVLLGIVVGILIDVVYTELFTCFAKWIAGQANNKTYQEYDTKVVNYTYPFEAAAFCFYFWVLAFVFIPFGSELQQWFLINDAGRFEISNAGDIDIYQPYKGTHVAPCKYVNDSVCDEWVGRCWNGSDTQDCAMFGCTDPSALNFIPPTSSNVTNGSVQHTVPTRSISPTQFAPYSLDMLSLPSGIQCVYEASVDGVNETTTCPSANDGRCDEPLHCLPLVSQLAPTIAEALFAECEEDLDGRPSACPFGSDIVDCRATAAEILEDCSDSEGCMTVLRARFTSGDASTPEDACRSFRPSDSSLCDAFPAVWNEPDTATDVAPALALHAASVRCRTRTAQQCVERCDPCVGCLSGVVDAAQRDGPNMTFCTEYDLCPQCVEACSEYTDCFSDEVKNRSRSGPACDRIGWTENDWCDAAAWTLTNASGLDCAEAPANRSWVCPADEDIVDCSAACNFGCLNPIDIGFKGVPRQGLEAACANETLTTVSHMLRVWMFDKQFINEIDLAIAVPLIIAQCVVMIFEYVMPMLCTAWWRSSRREEEYRGKKRCSRCCCLCRRCKCCIAQMNCYMCDEDAKSKGVFWTKDSAVERDDDKLAMAISSKLKEGKKNPKSHEVTVRRKAWSSKHRGHYKAVDDIIMQSQLDPIDLTTEYRKLCILIFSVVMWSIVWPFVPFLAYLLLEFRMQSDFTRLTRFARRPIPVKPKGHDATGGFRFWLDFQNYIACFVTVALFCFVTGQLEAWWALFDEQSCSPPKRMRTQWKYPHCTKDPVWFGTRLGEMWNESDPLDQYDPCAPSDPECTSSWDADDYPLMGKLLCLLPLRRTIQCS